MLACCVLIVVVVGQESCVWVFFAIGSSCGSSCVSASVCFGVSVVGFQRRYAILHKCGCRTVLHLGAPLSRRKRRKKCPYVQQWLACPYFYSNARYFTTLNLSTSTHHRPLLGYTSAGSDNHITRYVYIHAKHKSTTTGAFRTHPRISDIRPCTSWGWS